MQSGRLTVILAIMLGIFLIFLGRLFYIQVVTDAYSLWATQNAIRKTTIYPSRGIIYDRNAERVVVNSPIYDLMLIPNQMSPELDTMALCALLKIPKEILTERIIKAKKYSRFKPSLLLGQISVQEFASIQERLHEFPGIFPESRTVRQYPFKSAAHVLGYIGEVNEKRIDASNGYYQMGDYIGIAGIELSYEEVLRGKRGVRYQYVDVHNRIVGNYKDGAFDSMAIAGQPLQLSIDIALQNYLESLMANKKGSVVAIEPATGEVLAFVSAPNYDPNRLVGNVRGANYKKLLDDPEKPIFNRPLQAQYPPGSVFKPLQALIGQEMGILQPNTRYPCGGGYSMGSRTVKCTHVHDALKLDESIQFSCNPYYCWAFKNMIDHYQGKASSESYNIWRNFMNRFTVGLATGIDIPNEVQGILPSTTYYDKIYGEGRWKANTVISLSIGQGEVSMTTLQMANSMAIIANRGWYYPPHLVKAINNVPLVDSFYQTKRTVGIQPAYFKVVVDAMEQVVENGTARYYGKLDSIAICGKTGTAQNPHGEDHAVFVCFAPKDNPKIAIAVIVENAGFGGVWAAPIASLAIEKYLLGGTKRPQIETKILEAQIP